MPTATDHSTPSHWDQVYAQNGEAGVSWYQPFPRWSLEQIRLLLPHRSLALIDVGAGASTLVDELLLEGYQNITLLDCSAVALSLTRARLLANSDLAHHCQRVRWLQADLMTHEFPHHRDFRARYAPSQHAPCPHLEMIRPILTGSHRISRQVSRRRAVHQAPRGFPPGRRLHPGSSWWLGFSWGTGSVIHLTCLSP
jgi:hypothetical protein